MSPGRAARRWPIARSFAVGLLLGAMLLAPAAVRGQGTDPCREFPRLAAGFSARVGEPVQYTVTASAAFNRLDVKLRWGEGPEDALVSLSPGQSHTFTHTYAFAGQYGVHITASGPLAAGGACNVFEDLLGNIVVSSATTPPPPPPPPPGAPIGPGAIGEATLGSRTVGTPRPGGTATVASPGLLRAGAVAANTGVGAAGGFAGTTLVAQADETPTQARRRRIGEAVVACWLLGLPDGASVNAPGGQGLRELRIEISRFIGTSRPLAGSNEALFHLYFCIGFVRAMAQQQAEEAGPASASASTCRSSRRAFRVRRNRAGRMTGLTLSRSRPAANAARYSCALLDDATMIVRAKRSRGSLAAQVGRNMRFGVHRAPAAAPAAGRLRFDFGLRGG